MYPYDNDWGSNGGYNQDFYAQQQQQLAQTQAALDAANAQNAALGTQPTMPALPTRTDLVKPQYVSWVDENGNLRQEYILPESRKLPTYDEVLMDPRALNEIKERTYSKDLSNWAQMLNYRQGLEQSTAMDRTQKQGSSANAQAMSQLMQMGGLSGGAMERIARQGARDTAFQKNAVLRQGMGDRAGIGLADEGNKNELLKAIPGFEKSVADLKLNNNTLDMNRNQFDITQENTRNKYNLDNALAGVKDKNVYNQNWANEQNKSNQWWTEQQISTAQKQYEEQMSAWAANRQAVATEKAADDGGSWLCTEAGKSLKFVEAHKKLLSSFMREALKLDRETVRFYLFRCQTLLDKMKEKGADWNRNSLFVLSVMNLSQKGQMREAFDLYCDETISLIEKYWPECRDPSFLRIREIRKQELKKVGT